MMTSSRAQKRFFRSLVMFVSALALTYWLTTQLPNHVVAAVKQLSAATVSEQNVPPFGWPVATETDSNHHSQFLANKCYFVGYSNDRGDPLWVVYPLTAHQDGEVDKRQPKFITDTRTNAEIVHEHYNRSGYDRGHMAPNYAIGALCDDEAQKQTFLMSNIVPQSKALNQRWWERLERVELSHFTRIFEQVWVIDGPVFSAHPVALPNGPVQVPESCYKIFVAQKAGVWHVLAFMVDQGVEGKEPLSQYRTNIATIETRVGFDFLPQLPEAIKSALKQDKEDAAWRLDEVDMLPTRY